MAYTRAFLERAIDLATKLGYWDDVEHWSNELKKIQEEEAKNG